jgi:hypothetical protein
MQVELHETICHMIDKSLIGAASFNEEQTLREHLVTCDQCAEYLDASKRAIASLGGYAFAVDPSLHERVMASLALPLAKPVPLGWSRLAAVVLTLAGSFAAIRFSALAASIFGVAPEPLHRGLIALWIAPSVCLCVWFLLFSLSPDIRLHQKGLVS